MTLIETAGAVAAVIGSVTGLGYTIGRPLRRLLRQSEDWRSDWYGEPGRPGVPARDGVMERLARTEERLGRIEVAVSRNGGQGRRTVPRG